MYIDPVIYFFILGILINFIFPSFKLPKKAYTIISMYLLISIGLKGGISLRTWCCWQLFFQSFWIIVLAITCTFVAYLIIKSITHYSKNDIIVVAAHYGSISLGTFVVALNILHDMNIYYEPYIFLFVALMEFPSIIIANILMHNNRTNTRNFKKIIVNTFAHKSLYILFGSIVFAVILGHPLINIIQPVFFDLMRIVLGIFLLEMGISVGEKISTIKKSFKQIVISSIATTLACAFVGMLFGLFLKLSPGGVILMMVLAGSASYIAVPTSLRESHPKSNVPLALSHSLGVTFPFNVLLGIYLYIYCVQLYFNIS